MAGWGLKSLLVSVVGWAARSIEIRISLRVCERRAALGIAPNSERLDAGFSLLIYRLRL